VLQDVAGDRIDADEELVERVRSLGIPPAWKEVWICPDPRGHLQATGIDAAGRKQYLYHPLWRELRDRQKFETMEEFATALPRLRRQVEHDLEEDARPGAAGLTRTRVLACAARMLDVGLFRIGGEEYAKDDGGVGLATLCPAHVTIADGRAIFDYPAKSGVQRRHGMSDPDVVAILAALKRRRGGPEQLLAFRAGRGWRGVSSDDINDYVKAHLGEEFSAKDFRTWNGTVLAALFLARRWSDATTRTSRKRTMSAVAREVSVQLGNTPAVARRSYIDPRVFDRYLGGMTIKASLTQIEALDETSDQKRRRIERAVLDLLAENAASPAVVVHELPEAA
jgi:DNA topoisomerase-1